jgi:tetratricopeptide (TPR) repeat protein
LPPLVGGFAFVNNLNLMSGKKLLLALCLLFSNAAFPQNIHTIDSVLQTVNVSDSSHINKTIYALNLARTLNYEKGQANALHTLGFLYECKGNYPLALEKYLQCEYIRSKTGEDNLRAQVLVNIAYLYDKVKDYNSEIRYANEALKIAKEDSLKCFAYVSLGKGYLNKGYNDLAIEFFNTSITIKKEKGLTSSLYKDYSSLGNAYIKVKKYDSAIISFSKIYGYSSGKKDILARMYNNLGVSYHFKGDYKEAEQNYLESINLNVKDESGDACLNYAELLYQLGEKNKANEYLNKALDYNYNLAHLGRTLHFMERFEESSEVRDCLYRHSNMNYELLNHDGLKVARIENETLHERERQALKAKYETERKYKFMVISLSILFIGLIFKYVWDYYFRLKSVEKVLDNFYLDLRKKSKSGS